MAVFNVQPSKCKDYKRMIRSKGIQSFSIGKIFTYKCEKKAKEILTNQAKKIWSKVVDPYVKISDRHSNKRIKIALTKATKATGELA